MFGVLYLARGLDGARRFEGATSRVVAAGLVLLALITTGTLVYGYLRVPEGAVLGGTWLIALSIVVALASSLATAYLVSVAFAGWRADEEPGLGWALVVVSGVVTMLATAGFIAAAVWQVGAVDLMSTLFATATAIAGVALLAAFVLGLPSTEPIEWEEDDPEVESEPTLDPPAATTPGSAGS